MKSVVSHSGPVAHCSRKRLRNSMRVPKLLLPMLEKAGEATTSCERLVIEKDDRGAKEGLPQSHVARCGRVDWLLPAC